MAKKVFDNWSSLERYIKAQVNDVLDKEVSKLVKEEIQTAVSMDVYAAGDPVSYERRGLNKGTGSLGDPDTMTKDLNRSTLELTITPDADRNMKYSFPGIGYDISSSLAHNIVYGYGNKIEWYNKPRDFIKTAKENMEAAKSHVEVMKEGLRDRLGNSAVVS